MEVTEFDSYIRGYHAYQDIWNPVVGESLLLKRERCRLGSSHACFKEAIQTLEHVQHF